MSSNLNQVPHFTTPVNITVERFPTKEIFHLVSVEGTDITEKCYQSIAECCNEELIYSILFQEKLQGKKYTIEDAKGFINFAKHGWENNSYFVFLIKDPNDDIVGAVDIKSNNLDSSEIGYWISAKTPGVMTNVVIKLCEIAQRAGFRNLHAYTRKDNIKSQNVLLRAGFIDQGEVIKNNKLRLRFTRSLI